MTVIRSRFLPTPKQAEFLTAEEFIVYLSGGHGSAKTAALVHMGLQLSKANPGIPGIIASHTYSAQRKIIMPTIVEWFPGATHWPQGRDEASKALGPLVKSWRASDRILTMGDWCGGVEWHFGSADNPGSMEGANYAWALIDEPRLWTLEAYQIVVSRVRHPKASVRRVGVAGVPEMGWMYEHLRGNLPNVRRIKASTYDNPYLPEGYADQVSMTSRRRQAYIMGEFVHLEGSVFPGYDPAGGSVLDLQASQSVPTYGFLDFGFRRPYFGVLQDFPGIASDGTEGECVVDEHPGNEVAEAKHAQECAEMMQRQGLVMLDCYCDPAGKARNAQTRLSSLSIYEHAFRSAGVLAGRMLYQTSPVDRHIANGVEALGARLEDHHGVKRLFVAQHLTEREYAGSVQGIHLALLGLHYKKGDTTGKIVHDESSHPVDSLRYLTVGRHGVFADIDTSGWQDLGGQGAGTTMWASEMSGDF